MYSRLAQTPILPPPTPSNFEFFHLTCHSDWITPDNAMATRPTWFSPSYTTTTDATTEGNMFPTQFSSLEATKLPWLWQHQRNVSCNLLSFHRTYAYSVNITQTLTLKYFFYKNKTSSMECNICSSPSKHT